MWFIVGENLQLLSTVGEKKRRTRGSKNKCKLNAECGKTWTIMKTTIVFSALSFSCWCSAILRCFFPFHSYILIGMCMWMFLRRQLTQTNENTNKLCRMNAWASVFVSKSIVLIHFAITNIQDTPNETTLFDVLLVFRAGNAHYTYVTQTIYNTNVVIFENVFFAHHSYCSIVHIHISLSNGWFYCF